MNPVSAISLVIPRRACPPTPERRTSSYQCRCRLARLDRLLLVRWRSQRDDSQTRIKETGDGCCMTLWLKLPLPSRHSVMMALRASHGSGSDQLSSGNLSLKITLIAGYQRCPMPQSNGHNTEILGTRMMGKHEGSLETISAARRYATVLELNLMLPLASLETPRLLAGRSSTHPQIRL
jgi:hypothetical protein